VNHATTLVPTLLWVQTLVLGGHLLLQKFQKIIQASGMIDRWLVWADAVPSICGHAMDPPLSAVKPVWWGIAHWNRLGRISPA